jgi:hypothetical protein
MNSVLYICYQLRICSLKFWLTECRMCFKLETKCRFLYSNDGWANVSLSIATVALVATGEWRQHASSLLGVIVVMTIFCSSLLCCHCSDDLVTVSRLPVITVTYDPLLQCLFIVVLALSPARLKELRLHPSRAIETKSNRDLKQNQTAKKKDAWYANRP